MQHSAPATGPSRMVTVRIATELDAPADLVWAAVRTPQAFVHVAGVWLRYPPAERLERPWQVGDRLEGWVLALGLVPVSRHRLEIVDIDDATRWMMSDECGGLIRTWRHRLTVTPLSGDRCRYEDGLDVDAGRLTGLAARVAAGFFRYRQRRWRRLAPLLRATRQVLEG